jgi:glycosyltransferase involved in cell wall biosynthesis
MLVHRTQFIVLRGSKISMAAEIEGGGRPPRLSVYIMAENEGKRIRRALESVKDIAEELLVVDGGSTDDTVAIAMEYTPSVLVHKFEGYALQRQFALSQVHGEWVLAIDADETLSPELHDAIPHLITDTGVDAYDFSRRNYVKPGVWMKYGKMYPDYQRRLFRRTIAQYGDVVHAGEVPSIEGRTVRVDLDIIHDQTESSVPYSLTKILRFVHAEVKETQPTRSAMFYLYHAAFDPLNLIYKQYFLAQGYRMGVLGIRAACGHALVRGLVALRLAFKRETRNQ